MKLHEETTIKDIITVGIGISLIGYLLISTFLWNRDTFPIIAFIVILSFSISIPFSFVYVYFLERKEKRESFDNRMGEDNGI